MRPLQPLLIAFAFACGVLVWAVLCARARRLKKSFPSVEKHFNSNGCEICQRCSGIKACAHFPRHGHVWCRCGR